MKVSPLAYEVAHCSAWDDDHRPEKLVHASPGNNFYQQPQQPLLHLDTTTSEPYIDNGNSKGWQTPKSQSYPQDLIIHLLCGPARINKIQLLSHHYKIATKVDIYVGILKESVQELLQQSDDDTDTLIEFTRLGYIEFDDNARTQFKARELKSIKINTDGEYIRLVVRNNHQNHLNMDNQVGLLSLIVLGQPLTYDSLPSSLLEDQTTLLNETSSCRDASSLSSDDGDDQCQIYELSASGMMELELQHWIASLLQAESLAVQDESYQMAKTYKQLSDRLSHLSQLMVTFEQTKRQALDTRDYDEAEKIKVEINEIKQVAEMMIKQENLRIMDDGQVLPLKQVDDDDQVTTTTDYIYDDAVDKWTNKATTNEILTSIPSLSSSMSSKIQQRRQSQQMAAAERIILEKTGIPILGEDDGDNPDTIPEPIMHEERVTYGPAIIVFGELTVARVLDMKSKCRERGLRQIQHCMNAAYPLATTLDQLPRLFQRNLDNGDGDDDDDEKSSGAYLVNATLMMFQEAIMDARETIVILAIQIWQQLNDFCLAANVNNVATQMWTLRAFSGVLRRTGDSNLTIRDNAVDLVLLLANTHVDQTLFLDQFICQPDRMIHNHKEALARVHLVQRALDELKLQQKGGGGGGTIVFTQLVAFALAYLTHGHEDVQHQAMQLLLVIAAQVDWSTLAPLLDETTQQTLQSKLQKKPGSSTHLLHNKDAEVAELRALTIHSVEEKRLTSRKSDMNTNNTKRRPGTSVDKKKSQATMKKPTASKRTQRPPTTATATAVNGTKHATTSHSQEIPDDAMCIFCDEYNEHFNEQTLITHYYKNCPALTNCPMCQIIVEVSTLQSHTVTDCEKRHLMKQCTRCKKSIPVEQWLPHTLKAACSAYTNSEEETRCPLCLVTIEPGTDEGWRRHLLTGGGCPKNPRGSQHLDNTITITTTKKQQSTSDKKQHQPSSIRMKPSSLRKT